MCGRWVIEVDETNRRYEGKAKLTAGWLVLVVVVVVIIVGSEKWPSFIEILSLIVASTSHYRGEVGWVLFPRWGEDGGAVENVILVWLVAGRKTKLLVLLQFHITSVLLIILAPH